MRKGLLSTGILTIAVALGVCDAYLVEGGLPKAVLPDEPPTKQTLENQGNTDPQPSSEASEPQAGSRVRKMAGPEVEKIIVDLGFEMLPSDELSILRTVIPAAEATVEQHVLLTNGDRAGLVAWTESPKVKQYFLALKEALHASFSPHVQDLVDEMQRIPGKPPRNFLTFFDEGLSPERIVFLRVRERLYEIHVREGSDDIMFALVDALTQ